MAQPTGVFWQSECGTSAGFNSSFSRLGDTTIDWVFGTGLTDEVAYVVFAADGEPRWLRPVDGVGWIEPPGGKVTMPRQPTLTADGGLLRSAEAYRSEARLGAVKMSEDTEALLTDEELQGPSKAFADLLDRCLRSFGADPSTGTPGAGSDAGSVWSTCLDEAEVAWRRDIAALETNVAVLRDTQAPSPPRTEPP